VYRRLHLDNSQPVRVAAAKALASLTGGAGKGLGKHLKPLLPSWWSAIHDPAAEVAAEARAAFDAVFPAAKRPGRASPKYSLQLNLMLRALRPLCHPT
jgi:hypothetical protein